MNKMRKLILLIFICQFSLGCATVYNPATQREEFIFIDTKTEVALGAQIAYSIRRQHQLSHNPRFITRVRKIGQRIAEVSDRQDLYYNFKVIEDEEVNAFSTPGGYVYINTGLLEIVNDDELACVLAHEVGHIAARHSVKKLQAVIGYNVLMSFVLKGAKFQDLERLANISFNLISLGYSREDEFFADKLAIRYAYKAGFDPSAIIGFFEKLQALRGESPLKIDLLLRSHPYLSQRIANARRELALILNPTQSYEIPHIQKTQTKLRVEKKRPYQKSLTLGDKKICPRCKKEYPRRYNFCPKDGSKLIH